MPQWVITPTLGVCVCVCFDDNFSITEFCSVTFLVSELLTCFPDATVALLAALACDFRGDAQRPNSQAALVALQSLAWCQRGRGDEERNRAKEEEEWSYYNWVFKQSVIARWKGREDGWLSGDAPHDPRFWNNYWCIWPQTHPGTSAHTEALYLFPTVALRTAAVKGYSQKCKNCTEWKGQQLRSRRYCCLVTWSKHLRWFYLLVDKTCAFTTFPISNFLLLTEHTTNLYAFIPCGGHCLNNLSLKQIYSNLFVFEKPWKTAPLQVVSLVQHQRQEVKNTNICFAQNLYSYWVENTRPFLQWQPLTSVLRLKPFQNELKFKTYFNK